MRNRYNNIFRSSIVFLLKMSINEKKETGKFTDVPSYEEHARHLYHQQQYEAALVEYSRLLQEHPKDENLMIMIGNCWTAAGIKMLPSSGIKKPAGAIADQCWRFPIWQPLFIKSATIAGH